MLGWLIELLLFIPFTALKLFGDLLPTCASLQIESLAQDAADAAVHILEFFWPILQYFPIQQGFNLLSAILLYMIIRWLWKNFTWLLSFGLKFWAIIIAIYVIAAVMNVFIGDSWMGNSIFTETMGVTPTSTGFSGGGGGGGGGGSW